MALKLKPRATCAALDDLQVALQLLPLLVKVARRMSADLSVLPLSLLYYSI